jgi:hypothetical protein
MSVVLISSIKNPKVKSFTQTMRFKSKVHRFIQDTLFEYEGKWIEITDDQFIEVEKGIRLLFANMLGEGDVQTEVLQSTSSEESKE